VTVAEAMLAGGEHDTALGPPLDPPRLFLAARTGDALARAAVVEESRRIAAHIAAIAAVVDVELVVLGGGIGLNGDQLLDPIHEELARLLPFPPRVEVSTLGDAPVLTGALAVGLRHALDSVFEGRHARARRAKQRR
jgi:predicted NBD/HSP70 family sugar kinase